MEKTQKRKPTRKRIDSPFSKNLKSILEERGINLKSAAQLADVSSPVVHAWLQGGIPQNLTAVLRLSKALHCDFQWLVTGVHGEANSKNMSISEFFETQDDPAFSGIFQIEAKRLKRRQEE